MGPNKNATIKLSRYTPEQLASFKAKREASPVTVVNGFGMSVATDLVSNSSNAVAASDARFVGRAILFPPGTATGHPQGSEVNDYVFVFYVTKHGSPAQIFVPAGVDGADCLYVDLPKGIKKKLFKKISAAIVAYGSPGDGNTGNDDPPGYP
ncbi:MAG TPA: hypothetical protein VGG39_24450 [Polyangiaceae bacterium]|jgi:hypothetical protein